MSGLDLTRLDEVRDHLIYELERTQEDPQGDVPGGDGVLTGILRALEHHLEVKHPTHADATRYSPAYECHIASVLDQLAHEGKSELDEILLRCAGALHRMRLAWRLGEQASFMTFNDACTRLLWISEQVQLVDEGALTEALLSRLDGQGTSPYPTYSLKMAQSFYELCTRVKKHVDRCAELVGQSSSEVVECASLDPNAEHFDIAWESGPPDWAVDGTYLAMALPSWIWVEAGECGTHLVLRNEQ